MTLRDDGSAEWNGERYVDRIGRFKGQVAIADFERLTAFMERAGFFGWDDDYSGRVTDAPDYELVAVAGGRTKRVRQNATDEPPDFWVMAGLVDEISRGIDWTPGSLDGGCGRWTAMLNMDGVVAPLLTVRGVCTFPTDGYEVELRRHRPPSEDPQTLLLDRVVTAPSGVVADVITDVEVIYVERNVVDRVTILPDGATVDVEVIDRSLFD